MAMSLSGGLGRERARSPVEFALKCREIESPRFPPPCQFLLEDRGASSPAALLTRHTNAPPRSLTAHCTQPGCTLALGQTPASLHSQTLLPHAHTVLGAEARGHLYIRTRHLLLLRGPRLDPRRPSPPVGRGCLRVVGRGRPRCRVDGWTGRRGGCLLGPKAWAAADGLALIGRVVPVPAEPPPCARALLGANVIIAAAVGPAARVRALDSVLYAHTHGGCEAEGEASVAPFLGDRLEQVKIAAAPLALPVAKAHLQAARKEVAHVLVDGEAAVGEILGAVLPAAAVAIPAADVGALRFGPILVVIPLASPPAAQEGGAE